MKILIFLSKSFAVLAGLLLVVVTLITCVSLLGRNLIGRTLVGDFELTAVSAGVAIAFFLPWCQLQKGHIFVDFFTIRASEKSRAIMDRLGLVSLGAMQAILGWRAILGGLSAWQTGSGSMMLGFPDWISYALIAPGLLLGAFVAFVQALAANLSASPSAGAMN
jgi:TRAP-type C4-dicarboxylate transport system permease small subunit